MKIFSLFLALLFLLVSCNKSETKYNQDYKNQIGDTLFNSSLDDSSFKFCDSTNVLHKRAYVSYQGGMKALEEEFLNQFNFKSNFSGYFVVRFVVNCNNKAGRFRMEILDSNFQLTMCSDGLKKHILTIVKELKNWKHAIYKGKDYDCYRFLTLKLKNGKLIKT
jgi:hypothetical protein